MAFKFIAFATLLTVASAGYLAPVPTHYAAAPAVVAKVANPAVDAVATTHQNVVRSFGGTVSQYSKSVHTPYSSVHKEDTRVNNNVYTPAVAKTITYAAAAPTVAPLVTKTVYEQHVPAHGIYASSAPHSVYTHQQHAPVVYAAPAPTAAVYTHHHEVPSTATTSYNHGPAATTYTHNSPSVSAYGSTQTVHYSPAEMVSHMSFDGFGTHWGF